LIFVIVLSQGIVATVGERITIFQVHSMNNEILTDYKFLISMNESNTLVILKIDCEGDEVFQCGNWRALSAHRLP